MLNASQLLRAHGLVLARVQPEKIFKLETAILDKDYTSMPTNIHVFGYPFVSVSQDSYEAKLSDRVRININTVIFREGIVLGIAISAARLAAPLPMYLGAKFVFKESMSKPAVVDLLSKFKAYVTDAFEAASSLCGSDKNFSPTVKSLKSVKSFRDYVNIVNKTMYDTQTRRYDIVFQADADINKFEDDLNDVCEKYRAALSTVRR